MDKCSRLKLFKARVSIWSRATWAASAKYQKSDRADIPSYRPRHPNVGVLAGPSSSRAAFGAPVDRTRPASYSSDLGMTAPTGATPNLAPTTSVQLKPPSPTCMSREWLKSRLVVAGFCPNVLALLWAPTQAPGTRNTRRWVQTGSEVDDRGPAIAPCRPHPRCAARCWSLYLTQALACALVASAFAGALRF